MRIGISTTTLVPSTWKPDGIGQYTLSLMRSVLALEQGCQFTPYVSLPTRTIIKKLIYHATKKIFKAMHTTSNNNQSIKTHVYSRSPYIPMPLSYRNHIDIFHVTDYKIPYFIKGVPRIATLHDAIPFKHPQWVPKLCQEESKSKLKSIKSVDHIIAVSQAMLGDLVNYWNIPEEKITVVHSGIGEKWFHPLSEQQKNHVLDKYNLKPNFLLFVGTLQPRKNLDRIITAFLRLPGGLQKQHNLIIVGQNGWNSEATIVKLKALRMRSLGKWLNYVSFLELRALYQCASIIVFPSLSEGFGFPILEGFASQTPVITSNVTSMPEIAHDSALIIDPYSVEAIRQAMIALLTDKQLHQHYVNKGQQRVKHFTWQKTGHKTLKIYKEYL